MYLRIRAPMNSRSDAGDADAIDAMQVTQCVRCECVSMPAQYT